MKMLVEPPVEADGTLSTPVAAPAASPATQRMRALWGQCSIEQKRRLLPILERMAENQYTPTPGKGNDRYNPTGLNADRRSLAKAFPACFNRPRSKEAKRPLKIGITEEVMTRGVIGEDGHYLTPERIQRAVADYCTGTKYRAALVAGAVRIDLDGQPAGIVTSNETGRRRARRNAA